MRNELDVQANQARNADRTFRHPLLNPELKPRTVELAAWPDANSVNEIALKLACERHGNGRLSYAVRDVLVGPKDAMPLEARPWWLTESVVDDAIWSSHRALSWLADGKAVTAIRQPQLKAKSSKDYLLPDFAFLPHNSDAVRLVELEIDGQNHADPQLLEQLKFGKTNGYFDDDVELMGVDTRQTWLTRESSARPSARLQRCWYLTRSVDDPAGVWIMLGRQEVTKFFPKPSLPVKLAVPVPVRAFLNVELAKADALLHHGINKTLMASLTFRSKKQHGKCQLGTSLHHPGYMMKFASSWLAELAEHLAQNPTLSGVEWHWRVDHGTGRGNTANKARLYLYFQDNGCVEAVRDWLEVALEEFWTASRTGWDLQVKHAKDTESQAKAQERRARRA